MRPLLDTFGIEQRDTAYAHMNNVSQHKFN